MNRSKLVLIFMLMIVGRAAASDLNNTELRIMNGAEIDISSFPYTVLVAVHRPIGLVRYCAGSILSQDWVLTAAKCFQDAVKVIIHFGATSFEKKDTERYRYSVESSQYIRHHGYVEKKFVNDIALVKLSTPISFNEVIQPINLPMEGDYQNELATASGWGSIGSNDQSMAKSLRYGELIILNKRECASIVKMPESVLCTRGIRNQNICYGDGGAPLVLRRYNVLVGIGSFTTNCETGISGFTRVSSFLDWIAHYTGIRPSSGIHAISPNQNVSYGSSSSSGMVSGVVAGAENSFISSGSNSGSSSSSSSSSNANSQVNAAGAGGYVVGSHSSQKTESNDIKQQTASNNVVLQGNTIYLLPNGQTSPSPPPSPPPSPTPNNEPLPPQPLFKPFPTLPPLPYPSLPWQSPPLVPSTTPPPANNEQLPPQPLFKPFPTLPPLPYPSLPWQSPPLPPYKPNTLPNDPSIIATSNQNFQNFNQQAILQNSSSQQHYSNDRNNVYSGNYNQKLESHNQAASLQSASHYSHVQNSQGYVGSVNQNAYNGNRQQTNINGEQNNQLPINPISFNLPETGLDDAVEKNIDI